jgi:hypothetical protein
VAAAAELIDVTAAAQGGGDSADGGGCFTERGDGFADCGCVFANGGGGFGQVYASCGDDGG